MPARYCRPRSLSCCSSVGATSMPSLPPASLMKAVAVLWPSPREPKCTPNPDDPRLVLEQVDIVIAAADRAELVARHPLEMVDRLGLLPERAVEQVVLDLLRIAAAEPEADVARDLLDQR